MIVPALALAACTSGGSVKQDDAAIDAELIGLERQWAALAMSSDRGGLLERIIADDFSGMSDSGTVRTKAQEIAYWAKQPGTFAAAGPVTMTFHHYGGTVVGHGRQRLQFAGGGAPLNLVWTDTWMWRAGRWQVVASQDAVLPPDAVVPPDDAAGGDNMG